MFNEGGVCSLREGCSVREGYICMFSERYICTNTYISPPPPHPRLGTTSLVTTSAMCRREVGVCRMEVGVCRMEVGMKMDAMCIVTNLFTTPTMIQHPQHTPPHNHTQHTRLCHNHITLPMMHFPQHHTSPHLSHQPSTSLAHVIREVSTPPRGHTR